MLSLNAGLRAGALVAGNLESSGQRFGASIARIATGDRLAASGGDASTRALATRFASLVSEQRQVAYNISQASSVLQTPAGAMSLIHDALERLKVLTTQAASGGLTADARIGMASEIEGIVNQLSQTATATSFGSASLLNGTTEYEDGVKRNAYFMQLGTDNTGKESTIILTIPNVEPIEIFLGQTIDVSSTEAAKASQNAVNYALKRIASAEAEVGAQMNLLDMQLERARSLMLYGTDSRAELGDTDIPAESIILSATRVLQSMSIRVLAQLHAMQDDSLKLVDQQA